MARVKNSSFVGVRFADGDPDAPTYMQSLKDIAADTALVYDKLTGLNGETVLVDHSGTASGGYGCPLGLPIVNQCVSVRMEYESPTGLSTGKGGTGETILFAIPLWHASGEYQRYYTVEVDCDDDSWRDSIRLEVWTTAGAVTTSLMAWLPDPSGTGACYYGQTPIISAPSLVFLFIVVNTNPQFLTGAAPFVRGWRVFPNRTRASPGRAVISSDGVGVTTPAAAEGMSWRDLDASLFTANHAVNAYITSGVNRNLNGLTEYLTGWPAAGGSYTHEDHDGAGAALDVNPTRSRFHAGTQSLYASEPEPEFPLFAEAIGATGYDANPVVSTYSSGAQVGLIKWQPIIPNRKTSTTVHHTLTSYPDFPAGAGSNLKWAVLAAFYLDPTNASGNGPAEWTVKVGTAASINSATFTRIGTTSFAYATNSALDFDPDGHAVGTGIARLDIEKTGAGAKAGHDEIQLLGWCMYFDP